MTALPSQDPLVDEYLGALRKAARRLPRGQRQELLADIEAHLLAAAQEARGSEAALRDAIDALGPPDTIVASAAGPAGRSGPPFRDLATIALLLVGGIVVPFVGWLVGVVLLWSSEVWSTRHRVLATLVWPGGLGFVLIGLGVATHSTSSCSSGSVARLRVTGTPGPGAPTPVSPGSHTFFPSATTHCVTHTTGVVLPHWAGLLVLVVILVAPFVVAITLYTAAARARRDLALANP